MADTSTATATFNHPSYTLVGNDRIVRNKDAPEKSMAEEIEVINEMARYVEAKIISEYGFERVFIPDDEAEISTSILVTSDWQTNTKLLVMVQNAVGAMMGIFSRSICFDLGLSKGSMLPYIAKAKADGYAILILRANTNSVSVQPDVTKAPTKVPIEGSESPELHALFVWDNYIAKAENIKKIALLSYGNGASLCKDLLQRQMVRSKEDEMEPNCIIAICSIEASHILEEDDAVDFQKMLKSIAVNMECNTAPRGYRLGYRKEKLGCVSLSLGMPPDVASGDAIQNVAHAVPLALEPSFKFLQMGFSSTRNVAVSYAAAFASDEGLDPSTAEIVQQEVTASEFDSSGSEATAPTKKGGIFGFLGLGKTSPRPTSTKRGGDQPGGGSRKPGMNIGSDSDKLQVTDFDLLKVVGKGAFGKVMLVRKKANAGANQIYAMKVLKKSVISAKGQIEHTKSERSILCEIRHPYIVRLRFAFQSDDKLYLVTDYYNGGSLFYHLRKSRYFAEDRAKFYAAQLLSALDHLHQQHIIYRDLKLENVLMDNLGNIALTDFGLSKQNIDLTGGATTFCGTAEYIAPELLKGQKYGAGVDWWSFGILLFEMMHGRTPFYDKNRKLMFYRIINTTPSFPPQFSTEACDCIRSLLSVSEQDRLGAGSRGARDIMDTAFFSTIDFDKLLKRELVPPFKPDVVNEFDTKYVPKTYLQAEARDSEVDKKKGEVNPDFEAFTFKGEGAMDK
jgi:serum/glucocorticoid-regulated kinase 2